ncbi:N-6 DNA methylase [Floridanema evergladense]|uniref:site-specific DNA-methyltransferase (adenine-specific) n=1 Tax=Floridaenema evergladense BLCC-F167 TaxID=3153639 RepID=A0ABV4WD67_9CYAN
MTIELLQHCTFTGPALPEPFVRFELEKELTKAKLLPKTTGNEGKELDEAWQVYRRKLRELATRGGALRVRNHVITPLVKLLGYDRIESGGEVETREGLESGGEVLITADTSTKLRVWCTDFETDLDAPAKRGAAYRYSYLRIAQRVLLTCGERLGLLTNGVELRLLISDPARPDSQITIAIDPYWKRSRNIPDSFLLLLALVPPNGVKALPELVEKARLQQARVTKELRVQARRAVERFIQEILDRPENRNKIYLGETNTNTETDLLPSGMSRENLAKQLWKEGLIIVYRLLFILKLESSDNPAQAFSFASTSLWRNTFSPSMALANYARKVLDDGWETGSFLENGLRALFRLFAEGLSCTELNVKPFGGALFGANSTPILSKLKWGERAISHLLDQLLWTMPQAGKARERVHYGSLDVEDLGRVYEALLELEPGITTEPMCRLRRQKLEVVVPVAQGEKYRPVSSKEFSLELEQEEEEETEEEEEDTPKRGKKTKVDWIEEIPPGRFYLRVGLGRKASGSYYTPHSFVRFLVKETLEPQINEKSPKDDPKPGEILKLKVLDPAMGSGHFLVEACRFLGDKLYEACRLCDELATEAEKQAEEIKNRISSAELSAETELLEATLSKAKLYRQRVIDLPDPDDKLLKYLPSSAPEKEETGYSQTEAIALCRRLVAVHCLYGVDKNPLAVELAKLSLWLESHGEGLPLTFLDHRLVVGDSLTGPFFEHLLKEPGSQDDVQKLIWQGVNQQFRNAITEALKHVRDLEATIGVNISEIQAKEAAKARLDRALAPFKIVAAAWAGGVMLGKDKCDDIAYSRLVQTVGKTGDLPEYLGQVSGFGYQVLESSDAEQFNPEKSKLLAMIARGLGVESVPSKREDLLAVLVSGECVPALSYDLTFAEVFYPNGNLGNRQGFDAVLGNPPWDKLRVERRDLMASIDPQFLLGKEMAGTGEEHQLIEEAFLQHPEARTYELSINATKSLFPRICAGLNNASNVLETMGDMEQYRLFLIRVAVICSINGSLGFLVGGGLAKNPADIPTRRFIFQEFYINYFVHYLNLKQLFDGASTRISFVVIAGSRQSNYEQMLIGYEFTKFQDLIGDKTSNTSLTLVEPKKVQKQLNEDADLTKLLRKYSSDFNQGNNVIKALSLFNIEVGNDLHRTSDKDVLHELGEIIPNGVDARNPDTLEQLINEGFACCYDGRCIDFYNSYPTKKSGKWLPQVLVVANLNHPRFLKIHGRIKYFRLAWRSTCGHTSTNPRSARASILPPGTVASNSIIIENTPESRPNYLPLLACAVINSFTLDSQLRPVIQANLNKEVMSIGLWPSNLDYCHKVFVVHSCVRLSSVTRSFLFLWREQLGNEWREYEEVLGISDSGFRNKTPETRNLKPKFTFPVLSTDDERWLIRAAIDAVVAEAYGLNHEQYAHILSTFSHKSYPKAPQLCLACFDELQNIGLEAFTQKYDPYWDIPLNENLPKPVIELPIAEVNTNAVSTDDGTFQLTAPPTEKPKSRRKKK